MTEWIKLVLLILTLNFIEARYNNNQFMAANDCACRGHNVTYECTVFGSGATVWKGTAFDCSLSSNEFVFFHGVNYTLQNHLICNNGAIVGRVVRAENDSYTSQITVQISDELNGTSIVCAYDNGTVAEIGSVVLNITTVSFSPPSYIQLVEANSTHLRFNWSHVLSHCPSIQYHIMALNCGECPPTTHSNTVTCSGNYTQLTNDHPCSFAVGVAMCNGTIGDISIAVKVPIMGADKGPTDSKTSSLDAALLTSIVIALGAVVGVMFIVILFITLLFTTIMTILLKSKQAVHAELDFLKAKMKEQPVIYEEIAQLQDSLKSSSPTIDVGENTAYVTAVSMNACVRVST